MAVSAEAATATAQAWVNTATGAVASAQSGVDMGPMRAGDLVPVMVSLKVRNKAQLDALTDQLMAGSPGVKPLSSAEFLAQYAPTEQQAQQVVDYLRAQGFVNVQVADNRMTISANGSAGSVKGAFATELRAYQVDGRTAHANVTAAQVPAQLSDIVLAVGGLQTVHRARANPVLSQTAAGTAITQVSPAAFPAIYGAQNLPTAANTSIGIITIGNLTQPLIDLRTFAANASYPVPTTTVIPVNGGSTSTSNANEWSIDTQAALGAAGGAVKSLLLYNTASFSDADLSAAYARAVSDNKVRVISVSIQACESGMSSLATDNQTFQTAIAQGQTFVVSSGDNGAYACGEKGGLTVSWPASSPYVMAIGGTTLTSNNGNAWVGETAWSCTSPENCQNRPGQGGAGGGISAKQQASAAQRNSGVLGAGVMRGVPDISFDANPASGANILMNGVNVGYGGTSLAAPVFAGFWARIQSANGNTLPFPAATLYAGAATHPNWFHDVSAGNQGYAAGVGWDYATGYGSLHIGNFATAFGTTGSTSAALLVNGGFESSSASWAATTGVVCGAGCAGETPNAGTGFAWLNGYGSAHTDTLAQTVAIPAGKTSATLSFYLHIDTAETGTVANDKLSVQVLNSGGAVLATLATYSNVNAATGYALKSFNLTPYIGQTVTIKFTGTENATKQTSFVLDDISLTAQ